VIEGLVETNNFSDR